jgi:putative FmdB family regulatory protein
LWSGLPKFVPETRRDPAVGPGLSKLQQSPAALPGEVTMPQYDFLCSACKKKFERFSIFLTLSEYEKGKITCPECGSTKVEQQWAAFYAITGKKS